MRTSCAMMASSVTPPTEDEEVEVDGAVEVGGAAVCVWGYLSLNCAVLHRIVATSMAPYMRSRETQDRKRKNGKGVS